MHGVRVVMVENLYYFDLLCYTCLFSVIGGEARIEGLTERAPTTAQRLRPHGRCRTVERFTTLCRLAADSSDFFPEYWQAFEKTDRSARPKSVASADASNTTDGLHRLGVERYINSACAMCQLQAFLVEARETRVGQRRRSLLILKTLKLPKRI